MDPLDQKKADIALDLMKYAKLPPAVKRNLIIRTTLISVCVTLVVSVSAMTAFFYFTTPISADTAREIQTIVGEIADSEAGADQAQRARVRSRIYGELRDRYGISSYKHVPRYAGRREVARLQEMHTAKQ